MAKSPLPFRLATRCLCSFSFTPNQSPRLEPTDPAIGVSMVGAELTLENHLLKKGAPTEADAPIVEAYLSSPCWLSQSDSIAAIC